MGLAVSIRYIGAAGKRGGFQGASDAAVAWRTEAEALGARIERIVSEHREEVVTLSGRLEEATSQRDHLDGRVEELSHMNTELRELVMGERVPDALADALREISTGVIEYFDRLMAGIDRQIKANLEVHTALLATMEEEYLRPMLGRLERRLKDVPIEGPDRRKGNGQG